MADGAVRAVRAVRGAVQVVADDREEILSAVADLVREVLRRNDLDLADVISIVFTATPDLTAEFPAYAARRLGMTDVPLLCATEIGVPGALPRVVRLLAHVETDRPRARIRHVYLGGAAALRTDLPNRPQSMIHTVLVVGAGLVGSSVGLALRRAGVRVCLDDVAAAPLALAIELGVGERWAGERVDLAVLAVPPDAVAGVLVALQARGAARTYTDVASTKASVLRDAQAHGADFARFVGGHPLAGRERTGPAAARPDLFADRPWVVVPMPGSHPAAVADVHTLAELCGARVVEMDAVGHDAAVALVSHLPQLVASLLAGRLVHAPDEVLGLAGQGLRDTTRIAASDPELWVGIVAANASALARELAAYADLLGDLLAAVTRLAADPHDPNARRQVQETLVRGGMGRGRLPGKRGSRAPTSSVVPVVISDRLGELARLLTDVAAAGTNLDDLVLEHARGQPLGIAELHVPTAAADELAARLRSAGWPVRL